MNYPAGSHDSRSRHSPVDDEKGDLAVPSADFEIALPTELAPDPDAGLSDDERARIVCSPHQTRSWRGPVRY